ncbi:MAG: hypothetical protein FWG34_03395 [Oscillospiraceae bacterium]|nr:hypothetical protein [Oscillospiraceae bacterium]
MPKWFPIKLLVFAVLIVGMLLMLRFVHLRNGSKVLMLGIYTSILFHRDLFPRPLFYTIIAITAINFWSWGVMHNFVYNPMRNRTDEIPDFVALTNMISSAGIFVMFVLVVSWTIVDIFT